MLTKLDTRQTVVHIMPLIVTLTASVTGNTTVSVTEAMKSVTGPRGYKKNSCSTPLSMIFFLLINVEMLTIVGILTYMSRKNNILSLSEPENSSGP